MDSLLKQTYENYEVILIDDGSTDNSGVLCDEYANVDSRIKVIHKMNGGVSSARNEGLDHVQGKYVMFIDPDDYILEQMLFQMVSHMEMELVDMVECSYTKFYDNHITFDMQKKITGIMSNNEALQYFLKWEGIVTSFCWGKLYKYDILKSIRFNSNLKVGEDALFVYEYLKKCNKLYVDPIPMYRYYLRENSAIGNIYTSKRIDAIKSANIIRDDCFKELPDLISEANVHLGLATFYTCSVLVETIPWKNLRLYKDDLLVIKKSFQSVEISTIKKKCAKSTLILWSICKFSPIFYKITLPLRRGGR